MLGLVLYVTLVVLPVYQRRSAVRLPNGYFLKEQGKRIYLKAPDGKRLIEDQVSEFTVYGSNVYGWVDRSVPCFFLLDTKQGRIRTFATSAELNSALDAESIPKYNMKNDYTFWDIRSGRKPANW